MGISGCSKMRSREDRTHAFLLGSLQDDGLEAGDPAVDFASPVVQRRLRDDDKVRAVDAADEFEVAEEGDGLERLAETLWSNAIWSGFVAPIQEAKGLTISSAKIPLMPL